MYKKFQIQRGDVNLKTVISSQKHVNRLLLFLMLVMLVKRLSKGVILLRHTLDSYVSFTCFDGGFALNQPYPITATTKQNKQEAKVK